MSPRLRDVAASERFELYEGHIRLGLLQYQRAGEVLVVEHTEVDPRYQGKGYAGQLVRAVLDQARSEHRRAIVVCPFAKEWLRRHPEYVELDYTHGTPGLTSTVSTGKDA